MKLVRHTIGSLVVLPLTFGCAQSEIIVVPPADTGVDTYVPPPPPPSCPTADGSKQLSLTPSPVTAIAADVDSLYWSYADKSRTENPGVIWRAKTDGTGVKEFSDRTTCCALPPTDIQLRNTFVYWIDGTLGEEQQIYRTIPDAFKATVKIKKDQGVRGFTTTVKGIYTIGAKGIFRWDFFTPTSEDLAVSVSFGRGIAVTEENAMIVYTSGSEGVTRTNTDGSKPVVLDDTPAVGIGDSVVLDDVNAYWLLGPSAIPGSPKKLKRAPYGDKPPVQVDTIDTDVLYLRGLKNVPYWVSYDSSGPLSIMRKAITTGTGIKLLHSRRAKVTMLALTDKALFWVEVPTENLPAGTDAGTDGEAGLEAGAGGGGIANRCIMMKTLTTP